MWRVQLSHPSGKPKRSGVRRNVPANTMMRSGEVAPINGWGKGGGTQFELLERIDVSSYSNVRSIGN